MAAGKQSRGTANPILVGRRRGKRMRKGVVEMSAEISVAVAADALVGIELVVGESGPP